MIAVIDYDLGNVRSVCKALETAGADVELTSDPSVIAGARALVLPGVGAFSRGMENLIKKDLITPLRDAVGKGTLLLGICLGLQLLFTESEEHGVTGGLGLIPGKVVRFSPGLKVPHMGWNIVSPANRDLFLFRGIPEGARFYFVHSYYVVPDDPRDSIAATSYGQVFCAAAARGNVYGVQFHPEKSSDTGLKVLKNFVARSNSC